MRKGRIEYIKRLKPLLDEAVLNFNQPNFVEHDPISIPHQFKKKQDIEIAALMAAVLAWGQRTTIVKKTNEFLNWMDGAPHDFIRNHKPKDVKPFASFKHRTFNGTDALYFIEAFKNIYKKHASLEEAFPIAPDDDTTEQSLIQFHNVFFSLEFAPHRTRKHISTPARKSACKRLNMFLRWMVRKDNSGVDFGIWNKINPRQLVCPLDVHVERVARNLKLLNKQTTSWQTAVDLTKSLRILDSEDPVKYDFALFGLGINQKY